MPLRLWLFVVFFAGFPVVSVIGEIGPGRWANELQDALLGGHSGKLACLLSCSLNRMFSGIVVRAVGLITGRPRVRIRARKKELTQDAGSTDPVQRP